MFIGKSNSKTRNLTLLSIFAVIFTILRMIPTFPLVGVTGTFSASDVLAPLYGLILGPTIGAGSIILGTFLAFVFGRPMIFLGFDFLPAMVAAISVGFLMKRNILYVTLINITLIILFMINPLTVLLVEIPYGLQIPFNWLHFISILILISPIRKKAIDSIILRTKYFTLALFIIFFLGTMLQHLTGSLLFVTIFGLITGTISEEAWAAIWTAAFYVYPVERFIITIFSAVIGSTVIAALRYYPKLNQIGESEYN